MTVLGVWIGIRTVIVFALGVLLVFHSVFGNGAIDRVIELTVGLILLGIVPIDVFIARWTGHNADD